MPSRDYFIYSAEFLPLAASATTPVRISLQGDCDFELVGLAGDVRDLDTDETVIAQPAILLAIKDQGSGRDVFDRPQIWDNVVGTAERPAILPMPKTFTANSTIEVTLTNLIAATKRVRLSLMGYKHFPGPG